MSGYQLNRAGEAVERRDIYVQVDGLRLLAGHLAVRRERPGPSDEDVAPQNRQVMDRGEHSVTAVVSLSGND